MADKPVEPDGQSYNGDITELEQLDMDMGMGCLRALPQAIAYCVENNVALPVEFVRVLARLPDLCLDDRYSRAERFAVRAAAFEVVEEHFGVDRLESSDSINKKRITEYVAELLPPNLSAGIQTLSHWWYGASRGTPHRHKIQSDFQWYQRFSREAKQVLPKK